MMIVLFCMLIVISLCHCNDLPSRIEVESSINRTIDEVEKLIRQNATLPQLTRQEIIDILFNITSKDLETHQGKKGAIEEARNIYKKALMVVLPYNAEDARESIRDLYTKPPRVELITDPSSNPQNFVGKHEAWKNKKLQANAFKQEAQHDRQSLENFIATHAPEVDLPQENPPAQTRYKNHRETYSEERMHSNLSAKGALRSDSAPIKFSFNLENLPKRPSSTEATTVKRPVYRGSSLTKDEDVYIVYSTSATTIPPGRVEMKENVGPRATSPSKLNENVLSVDQWRYNAPTTHGTTTSRGLPDAPFKRIRDKQPSFSTTASLENTAPVSEIDPEISRVIATTEKTPNVGAERSAPIYVTPMSSSSSPSPTTPPSPSSSSSERLKYNSTYSLNSGGFRRIATATTTTTMRPEVMDLLASIGLRPKNASNVEDVFKKSKEGLETKSQISNGPAYTTSGLSAVAPDSPSIAAQNTFESPVSEIGKGMNNLTPDVQLLFQRFGLQTSNMVTTTMPTPKSTANSYTNFKPLPTSRIKNEDMKEFLARFGLGDGRQKKAMPASTERPSLIEAVPDNMRQILENIGLISRKTSRTSKERVEPTKAPNVHIFKPHEVRVKDEGQRTKINELLDKIRLVQEGKASAKDVRKVADDLLATTKTLRDGPDPLNLEEIIKVYGEDLKNEVKRQQKPSDETVENTANDRALANTTAAPTGIKRFMISILGTSEFWVERVVQGLARIRRVLTNNGR